MSEAAARIVDDYLGRVDRAATRAGLSESRLRELREHLGDHLAEVRANAGSTDPVIVALDAIDRLGDPEDIVAAAIDDEPTVIRPAAHVPRANDPGAAPRSEQRGPVFSPPRVGETHERPDPIAGQRRDDPSTWEAREVAALIFVAFGWMAPILGFLVGAVLAARCRRWTAQERAAAIVLPLTGQVIWAAGLFANWIDEPGFTLRFGLGAGGGLQGIPAIIGLATAGLLLWSLGRHPVALRAGQERTAQSQPQSTSRAAPTTPGLQPVEIAAIAGIGLGWMIGGIGTLIGIVATIIGPRWSGGQKAVALLLPLVATLFSFSVLVTSADPLTGMLGFVSVGLLTSVGSAYYLWTALPPAARSYRG